MYKFRSSFITTAYLNHQQWVIINSSPTILSKETYHSLFPTWFNLGRKPKYQRISPSDFIPGLAWLVMIWMWALESEVWGGVLALSLTACMPFHYFTALNQQSKIRTVIVPTYFTGLLWTVDELAFVRNSAWGLVHSIKQLLLLFFLLFLCAVAQSSLTPWLQPSFSFTVISKFCK